MGTYTAVVRCRESFVREELAKLISENKKMGSQIAGRFFSWGLESPVNQKTFCRESASAALFNG